MKWLSLVGSIGLFAVLAIRVEAQGLLDCSCLSTQAVLFTNTCSGFIPDLCGPANKCYSSTIVPPPGFTCTQNPPPGTFVTASTVINFVLTENLSGNTAVCSVTYNVGASTNVFTALCAPTQVVPCSTTNLSFAPPGWTNTCCTSGMTTNLVSLVTNWPTITANWLLVDGCGVAATCSQSIAFFDPNGGPCVCVGITCPSDIVIQTCFPPFPSSTLPAFTNVSYPLPIATNYCIGTITNIVCTPPSGSPFPVGTNVITCTAFDNLGNSSVCHFEIVVLGDTTPPVMICPSPQTNQCGSTWVPIAPTAVDACCGPNVTIILIGAITNTFAPCDDLITFKWLAIDCNGNQTLCNSVVHLLDLVPPVITCRGNYTIPCGSPILPPVVTDNCCLHPTVTMLNVITNGIVPCNYTLTITWQAQDCCTNTATCTEVVTIIDTAPPVLTCASNKTIQCGDAWTFDPPDVFDACSGTNVLLTITGTFTNVFSPCLTVATRKWEAVDLCSNTSICNQVVSIMDTAPPALTCATNKTVQCGSAWSFDPPTAFDVCCGTNVTIALLSTNVVGGPCPSVLSAIWQATDCCNNSITCTQLVTVVDTAPPVLTCASNKTVQCGTGWVFDPPTGIDVCAGTNLTYQLLPPVLISSNQCQKIWSGAWQVSDLCSNSSVCTQIVTEVDTLAPVVVCTNKTVQCGTPWTFNAPSASDLCCTNLTFQLLSSNLVSATACQTIWAGGWRVTDCCGSNSSVCTQLVTVVDTQPPIMTCPANFTVPFGTPWTFGQPTAFDACCGTNVTITTILTWTNYSPANCQTFYRRLWRATDCCGRYATCIQTVTAPTGPPPVNDFCTNPLSIVVNAPYICGSSLCATPSGNLSPLPCGNSSSSPDVWYSVVAQCTGPMTADTCAPCPGQPTFDTVLSAYTGNCPGPLTQVSPTACNDNSCGLRSSITFNAIAGQTYLLRVAGAGATVAGWFSIRAQQTSPTPPNDLWTNAIPVSAGVPVCGSTVCATPSGGAIPTPCGNSVNTPDVWYTYTPQCSGQVTIDTCGTCIPCPICVANPQFNTVLSVYTGQYPSLTQWACNDDALAGPCVGSPQSRVTFAAVAGVPYSIRVSGAGPGTIGLFRLNVSFIPGPPPANDLCANATPITPGVYPWNNCGANTDGPTNFLCFTQPSQDVWFKYTAPCAGAVSASACSGGPTTAALQVFSGTCGSLNSIGCTFWGNTNCPSTLPVTFAATAGTTYYIRVGSLIPGAPAIGAGMLTLVGPNPPSPTCPPAGACTWRYFRIVGPPNCTAWSWSLTAPCCMNIQNSNVAPVCGGDENTMAAAFVASINAAGCGGIAQAFPAAAPNIGRFGICTTCTGPNAFVLSVGQAGATPQTQCAIPNPGGYVAIPINWCFFNPDISEIPLTGHDLNNNGVDDGFDIDIGTSEDVNGNGIPDEVESCLPPVLAAEPQSQVVSLGASVNLSVSVNGTAPFSYQWSHDGMPVSDDLNISGATTANLTISALTVIDTGDYSVTVSNACGVLTTSPANVFLEPVARPFLYDMSLVEGWFHILVETRLGFDYFIEYKNDLNDDAWTTLSIVAGSGQSELILDSEPLPQTRFYRVRQETHP